MKARRNCCLSCPAKAVSIGFVVLVGFFFGNAQAHADNIFVASEGTSTIEEFDSSGNGTTFGDLGGVPSAFLAFDSSGNLYVSSPDGNIYKFDSNGNRTIFASLGSSDPLGLAFDSRGNLYVADFKDNGVLKFDSSGNSSVFATFAFWEGPRGWCLTATGIFTSRPFTETISRKSIQTVRFQPSSWEMETALRVSPLIAVGISM